MNIFSIISETSNTSNMKTIESKTIVYDNACPMCSWYTGLFVRSGALSKAGRLSFSQLDKETLACLDLKRSRHEIPLIDTLNGQVLYGLDGLLLIFSHLIPVLKPVFTSRLFRKAVKPLYLFISYNRRIIAGTYYGGVGVDCAPDFHLGWRLL